jgi:hypothetical protein
MRRRGALDDGLMCVYEKTASLAPIVVALMLLASVSLLGYVVAFWPGEPTGAPAQPRDEPAPSALRSFEGSSFAPAPERRPRSQWM